MTTTAKTLKSCLSRTALRGQLSLPALLLSSAICAAYAGTCPAFGGDTDCGTIITVTDSGAAARPTGQPPYDGSDDTLVGVVNNSKISLNSMTLTSSFGIFDFDGDGIDTFGAPGNSKDSTGYGGPDTYFTNYSSLTGTVNFVTPLKPGQTTYFSLENALGSAVACTDLINNAIKDTPAGTNIYATFTPNQSYTLQQAAALCGFKNFDWVQLTTKVYDPYPLVARNLNGAFNPNIKGSVQILSSYVPFNDPPPGGGYIASSGPYVTPDFSYPFYYDAVTNNGKELTDKELGGLTLNFGDRPLNPCMQGGAGVNTSQCMNTAEPKGAATYFITHLAGVNTDGSAQDLGIGFNWYSNYNGNGSGGVATSKTDLTGPTDIPAITVDSVNEISNYNYSGITVTGINGKSMGSSAALLTGAQFQIVRWKGNVTKKEEPVQLENIGTSTINGPINIVLTSLTPGVTLVNANGTFGGSPYITVNVSLKPGQSTPVTLHYSFSGSLKVQYNPIGYTGTLQ